MSTLLLGFLVLFVLSLIPMGWVTLRAYRRFRGTRVVTCPETGCGAAVELDRAHAAKTSAMGELDLRVTSCTRWPERKECARECVTQIEESPDACLVRNMLVDWYRGADCVVCHAQIPEIRGYDEHAFLNPDGRTIEWGLVRPEDLPRVFATHRPVCWTCHTKSFGSQFPNLVAVRHAERPVP